MVTEGTYPHQFGGVSVWCDQIVRGMPGYEFELLALVATGAEQVVWELPGNVSSVVKVPLWGTPPTGPKAGRALRLPSRLLRQLISSLLDPSPESERRFGDVIRKLFDFAQRGNLSAALSSGRAVRLLTEAWQSWWEGDEQPAPNLNDAVTAMQLLDHCLRPLSHPPSARTSCTWPRTGWACSRR